MKCLPLYYLSLILFCTATPSAEEIWKSYEVSSSLTRMIFDPYHNRTVFQGEYVWICAGNRSTNINELLRIDKRTDILERFTTEDGLAGNIVYDLALDNDGILWICTDGGLCSWDGAKFDSYPESLRPEDIENIVHVGVLDIEIDSQNRKWFCHLNGYPDGVTCYDGENWIHYSKNDGAGQLNIRSITIDRFDNIWLCGNSGISKFDGSTWTVFNRFNSDFFMPFNSMGKIFFDSNDTMWARYGHETIFGVLRYDGTTWRNFFPRGDKSRVDIDMLIDAHDTVWMTFYNQGIWFYRDGVETLINEEDGLPTDRLGRIAVENDGTLWVTLFPGIARYDGTTWKYYTKEDGLISDGVLDIEIDSNGLKWFVTTDGISCLDDVGYYSTITAVENEESLPVSITIDSIYPNPFNPSTTIEFSLAETGSVTLDIYTVGGQIVRTLVAERFLAGKHSIVWNGEDDSGSPVSSGVYISRLTAGSQFVSGRMTLVR